MSSDTFVITVLEHPAPRLQIWRARNTTAGGVNDYAVTRSFALSAILDAQAARFPELARAACSRAWFQAEVARYIDNVFFLGEINERPDWPPDVPPRSAFASLRAYEDHLAQTHHHVILAVEVLDPALLEGLPSVFGTAAFDWWWGDPTRSPTPDLGRSAERVAAALPSWILESLEFHKDG